VRLPGLSDSVRRLGGPNAVSWPAFWVTYGLNIAAHFTTSGGVQAPVWTRLLVVTASQIAMFTPLVILRRTLLNNEDRSHPWVTVLAFAGAGVLRGVVVTSLLVALGAVQEARWGFRISSSIVTQCTTLTLAALVVDSLRQHRQRLSTLMANRAALEESRVRAQSLLVERNDEAVERLKAVLFEEMGRIDRDAPEQAAVDLHRTAADVVRPMSHELASSIPTWAPKPLPAEALKLDWSEVLDDATRGRPLRPVATGLCLGVVASVFVLSAFGDQGPVILLLTIVGTMLSLWVGNVVLAAVLPGRSLVARVALVIAGVAAASLMVCGAVLWAVQGSAEKWAAIAAGLTFIPAITMLLTLARAAFEQQGRIEGELERSEADLRCGLARVNQVQWFQQKALSRALHGPMQSAVTSAALRIDEAIRSGSATVELIGELRGELLSSVDVLAAPHAVVSSMADATDRLIGMWEGVCEVTFQVERAAADLLDGDEVLRSCVIDVVTEATSNSVRHGRAKHVFLSVTTDGPLMVLSVVDDGQSEAIGSGGNRAAGLGTRILDECAVDWSRRENAIGSDLTVRLPCA
jgi:hypothetical protein